MKSVSRMPLKQFRQCKQKVWVCIIGLYQNSRYKNIFIFTLGVNIPKFCVLVFSNSESWPSGILETLSDSMYFSSFVLSWALSATMLPPNGVIYSYLWFLYSRCNAFFLGCLARSIPVSFWSNSVFTDMKKSWYLCLCYFSILHKFIEAFWWFLTQPMWWMCRTEIGIWM